MSASPVCVVGWGLKDGSCYRCLLMAVSGEEVTLHGMLGPAPPVLKLHQPMQVTEPTRDRKREVQVVLLNSYSSVRP